MPRERKFLYVPYNDKDEAKKLGAIWDAKEKKFYVPFYMDQSIFKKWENPPIKQNNININEALFQFKNALQAQGLIVDTPIMNGKIQRCATQDDKGHEKSGAYVGYLDGFPAGYIENFKTGYKENWKFQLSTHNNSIKIQRQPLNPKSNFNETHINKDQELLNLQKKTALRLEKEWIEAKPLIKLHPYLIKKGLDETYNLKVDNYGNLLIPFQDETGKIWSIQRITKEGKKIIGVIKTKEEQNKNVEYSARKKGCFFTQIPLKEQEEFIVCEGFATAMTIQKALQKPTIMAIDAGNLSNVVENLKKTFPNKQLTIIADNDYKLEIQGRTNVGLEAAKKIQQNYPNVKLVIPQITEQEAKEGISDFNDIYTKKGLDEIRKQYHTQTFQNTIDKNKLDLER
ncbi:DNA primase [Campylobacter sp. MIT 12-8780]|uniref:DUF5710 domain-containing protein n=1 Tax=unclassified Campylobacter TaxID=2593542 RepID=UPI0010F5363F|nr:MULTISPECIES: DUF5710 domain-containing protein [unclassified Campylobacter]NDJ28048.1 toprim domain-containing protein [Campylobacter sp. MIT 19-121]TKX28275.1 DNA primase [Campylobacter sp. MIT 12-5580]TQR39983.1 DNA primase [Campylobacter sp. MIT 12-8780]